MTSHVLAAVALFPQSDHHELVMRNMRQHETNSSRIR